MLGADHIAENRVIPCSYSVDGHLNHVRKYMHHHSLFYIHVYNLIFQFIILLRYS